MLAMLMFAMLVALICASISLHMQKFTKLESLSLLAKSIKHSASISFLARGENHLKIRGSSRSYLLSLIDVNSMGNFITGHNEMNECFCSQFQLFQQSEISFFQYFDQIAPEKQGVSHLVI